MSLLLLMIIMVMEGMMEMMMLIVFVMMMRMTTVLLSVWLAGLGVRAMPVMWGAAAAAAGAELYTCTHR